jgi:hypothetical protein
VDWDSRQVPDLQLLEEQSASDVQDCPSTQSGEQFGDVGVEALQVVVLESQV